MSTTGSDAIEMTRHLVRMNTVNPPGNEHIPAGFLGQLLEKAGFQVAYHSVAPNRTSLVARLTANRGVRPLCFTGHLDTVPLGGTPWDYAPHGGEIVGDRLYGRGASDMKAGICAFVAAALRCTRRAPRATDLTLVLTAGEETGCEGARHLASLDGALGDAGALVVGEPTANYPIVGHKGVLWLNARTRGVTAHSSMPECGVNAIYRARRLLDKLEHFHFDRHHAVLGAPTLNVGTMRGGDNINSVPDLVELGIDIRTVPGTDSEELRRRLADHLAPELGELEPIMDIAPLYSSPDAPWIKRVFDVVEPLIGTRPVARGAPYFTDACALKAVYRQAPAVILGPGEPRQAHQTNEFCLLSRIIQAVDIYGALIEDWNGTAQAAAWPLSRTA